MLDDLIGFEARALLTFRMTLPGMLGQGLGCESGTELQPASLHRQRALCRSRAVHQATSLLHRTYFMP